MKYTDEHIKFILKLKQNTDLTYREITDMFNEKFDQSRNMNMIEKVYLRYKSCFVISEEELNDDVLIKNLKATHSARKAVSKVRKENQVLLEHQVTLDEVLTKFEDILQKNPIQKLKVAKPPKVNKKKTKLVVEPLVSDLHYGLKTKSYNADIARNRLRHYTEFIIKEIHRKETVYNIVKIHAALLADFMQGFSFHGKSSVQSCHLTDAEQIAIAVESLFYDHIAPLAQLGYHIDISGVCGNHDRTDTNQHTVNPGSTYFTYTIYKMLELLCKESGLKNVKFEIPEAVYLVKNIFGCNFLYEHGHTLKGSTDKSLEQQLIKRQAQVGSILSGIRIGHFHHDVIDHFGRHIVNASSVSDDHYGDILGYKSRPGQVINFYTDGKRDTSFYHSITVDLSEVN